VVLTIGSPRVRASPGSNDQMKDLAVRLSREQIREGLRRSRKWQADWEKRNNVEGATVSPPK